MLRPFKADGPQLVWDESCPVCEHPSQMLRPGQPFWLPCRTRWRDLDPDGIRRVLDPDARCQNYGEAYIMGQGRPDRIWSRTFLRKCLDCRRKEEMADPSRARPYAEMVRDQEIRSRLLVDERGYVFYRSAGSDKRPVWQRAGVPQEFAGFSLDKKSCKTLKKPGIGIPRAHREEGVTYLPHVSDPGASAFHRAIGTLRSILSKQLWCSVLLAGGNGSGKSHLAFAFAQDAVTFGFSVAVLREQELQVQMLRAHRDESGHDLKLVNARLDLLTKADVLIHDELAFTPGSQSQQEQIPMSVVRAVADLIYARRDAGKITIWTTNATIRPTQVGSVVNPPGLQARLGDALYSRIQGECAGNTFWLDGRDWRVETPMLELVKSDTSER